MNINTLTIQVFASLVLYLFGFLGSPALHQRLSNEAARGFFGVIAFILLAATAYIATQTRFYFVSATLAYLTLLSVEYAKVTSNRNNELSRWFGPNSVELLKDVSLDQATMRRILNRFANTARRQGVVPAAAIEASLCIFPSTIEGYWLYDLDERYLYRHGGRQVVPLRLRLRPNFFDLPRELRHQARVPYRTDPSSEKWTVSYWPVVAIDDWSDFVGAISVEVVQSQSRDPNKRRTVHLNRQDTFDSRILSGNVPSVMEYSSSIEVDDEWDHLTLSLRSVPHAKVSPSLSFYAWDVCDGHWEIDVETQEQPKSHHLPRPEITRIFPITSVDIAVETEWKSHTGRVRFRANDMVILPDDSVVIIIRDSQHAPPLNPKSP